MRPPLVVSSDGTLGKVCDQMLLVGEEGRRNLVPW
jgi:hypothetical protein